MTKHPKRQLAGGMPRRPEAPACLACAYRRGSNEYLRAYADQGQAPADFSGHLFTGATDAAGQHFVLVSQFDRGRQHGLAIVPLEGREQFMERLERTAVNYLGMIEDDRLALEEALRKDAEDAGETEVADDRIATITYDADDSIEVSE